MTLLLIGLVSVLVVPNAIWIAFARLGQRPARSLPNDVGHVLVHANLDKGAAWAFATLVVAGLVAGAYRSWQIESWGLAFYVLVLCIPAGWLAAIYLRKQRNVVELTETGIAWRRGSLAIAIQWSDVADFTEAPFAWIVHARDGRTLRVDKLLVGTPTTFLDYLKAHVSAHIYDTAFAFIRPRAALRARLHRHVSPRS